MFFLWLVVDAKVTVADGQCVLILRVLWYGGSNIIVNSVCFNWQYVLVVE
jgi:hypothetical protein